MLCPKCNYAMTSFDVDCPRCSRTGNTVGTQQLSSANGNIAGQVSSPVIKTPPVVSGRGMVWVLRMLFTLMLTAFGIGLVMRSMFGFWADNVGPQNDRFEAYMKQKINTDLQARNCSISCVDVTLLLVRPYYYSGQAKYSDGSTLGVEVMLDAGGADRESDNYRVPSACGH